MNITGSHQKRDGIAILNRGGYVQRDYDGESGDFGPGSRLYFSHSATFDKTKPMDYDATLSKVRHGEWFISYFDKGIKT